MRIEELSALGKAASLIRVKLCYARAPPISAEDKCCHREMDKRRKKEDDKNERQRRGKRKNGTRRDEKFKKKKGKRKLWKEGGTVWERS